MSFLSRGMSIAILFCFLGINITQANSSHIPEKNLPESQIIIDSGNMKVTFQKTDTGLELKSLFDKTANQQLAAAKQPPLFEINLRQPYVQKPLTTAAVEDDSKPAVAKLPKLVANCGWSKIEFQKENNGAVAIHFTQPKDPELTGLAVTLQATPEPSKNSLAWSIAVQNNSATWSLASVVFPQIALADQGEQMSLLVPSCSGKVELEPCKRANYQYRNLYPNGWCTMAFEAVYCPTTNTGLYWAMHDPMGSMKYISAKVNPTDDTLILAFEHPVPGMGKQNIDFKLPGTAVWQFFRGDWFDASMIYRDWVRKNAKWYPQLSDEGREDTPLWMRESPAWTRMRGKPDKIVPAVKHFHEYLGIPVAIHWYDWHQIPYDNDYPHYFPAVKGFVEGVAELQKSGVYVMPYINGRLWDTRDREDQDFEFTAKALPAATIQESGRPYTETYASKEKDGSKVELAPMCPSTKVWQEKVAEVVAHHFREHGVNGVYIDQIAAASPKLCFNSSHGHPIGGGCWWNEGYWKMLDAIRAEKPSDSILTTECNSEPFLRWFDGYLSWHWHDNGQVPAFSAVYGGAIQIFGRAFYDDTWKGIAMRMKVGQQLCFGEQIGWINPAVVDDEEAGPFFRQIARLRYALRRYFYAGEMARPPKTGKVATVTADWRWFGERIVTTPIVMTGAWRLPKENQTALFLVNISDKPVTTTITFNPVDYGFDGKHPLNVTVRTEVTGSESKSETFTLNEGRREVTLPALSAQVWELQEAK